MAKIKCKYDEIIDLHKLVGHKNNANKHPDNQVKLLAKNIDFQGWRLPIIVSNRSGMVVAGHGRMLAAEKLKEEKVPVVYQDFETEAQEYAFLISENKLSELAQHDDAIMIDTLRDMDFDLDFDLLGMDNFELPEIKQLDEANEDTVPENVETRCKKGDLWILGEHRLLCGDSTNVLDVEKLMNGDKADMVFTDPPYGMNYQADWTGVSQKTDNAKAFLSDTGAAGRNYKRDNVKNDDKDFDPGFFLEYFKDVKEQFWWGMDYYSERIKDRNNGSIIVWDKRSHENGGTLDKVLGSCFELCWSKKKHKRDIARIRWAGMFGTEKEHDKKRVHPTQKPVLLAEWFFDKWGKGLTNVVDLYGGSGSTLIACEKTNRKCYMSELDPHYCDVILTRWMKYTDKTAYLIETQGEKLKEPVPYAEVSLNLEANIKTE